MKGALRLAIFGISDFRIPGLSGLVAGNSAICGRIGISEALTTSKKKGGLGLRVSNRSGLRPAAI